MSAGAGEHAMVCGSGKSQMVPLFICFLVKRCAAETPILLCGMAQPGATMYTMILLLYLQRGVDVMLDGVQLRGSFRDRAACEHAALKLRGAMPIPGGYAAA